MLVIIFCRRQLGALNQAPASCFKGMFYRLQEMSE